MKEKKICPLTKSDCYGEDCAMWNMGECGLLTQARKAEESASELYCIRRTLEDRL